MIDTTNSITFQVEDLKQPDKLLALKSPNAIFRELMLSDVMLYESKVEENKIDFPFNVVAQQQLPKGLVSFGYHSFFNGMYQAYADHRPFVLSPDSIWLLISQGFAHHVNNHAEELRAQFVDFTGKIDLIVQNDAIDLNNPDSPWEDVFPEFTKKIGEVTGEALMNALTCDFSTTTRASKVAAEITMMHAMKNYFEFIVVTCVCGIPEITLEGTADDWQKLVEKANYLRQYKLDWWIDELEPVLEQFVKAAQGLVDKDFWRNMFKSHEQDGYGAPDMIDGWFVRFFPYDKDGKRNNLKELTDKDNLPEEIVKVDLLHIKFGAGEPVETPLELWAGFVGLEQNSDTFALKPQIGWMIKKKDTANQALVEKLKSDNASKWGGISIRVKSFPYEVLNVGPIKYMELYFTDEIDVPDEIAEIEIGRLRIEGKISPEGTERICRLLPNTPLFINRAIYNMPKSDNDDEIQVWSF